MLDAAERRAYLDDILAAHPLHAGLNILDVVASRQTVDGLHGPLWTPRYVVVAER